MKRRMLLGVFLAALFETSLAQKPEAKTVQITARKFTFTPNVVTLKKGVPVVLEFTSADVFMGFNAPDLNIRADIIPGQTARLRFTPDKAGSFVYLCDIFCGDGHERMTGKIRVVA